MESLTTRFISNVFIPYVGLLKAKYRFHPTFAHARELWERKLADGELINGPFLEKAHLYRPGADLKDLDLHEETRATVATRLNNRPLWKHQTDAIQRLRGDRNVVIATGTSSGKTLCYQIPILDDLVRRPSQGLRAVIIYPLNALVNDQLTEWEQMLARHPGITFARFTGQTPRDEAEYEARLRESLRQEISEQHLPQQDQQIAVESRLRQLRKAESANRLNHRDAIRSTPPNILVTNFSMLEYLLERPIDAPIFEHADLRFLVLDDAHAYRGVQSTEIAFLIRRLKDRLRPTSLRCIATSATLGEPGNTASEARVREFATEIFGEEFVEPNPIYGTSDDPKCGPEPFSPTPDQYIAAANCLRTGAADEAVAALGLSRQTPLADALASDENLHKLRTEILKKPTLVSRAAAALWPSLTKGQDGLQSLLQLVAASKSDDAHEELLPTRLHYFFRAQGGLHVCLHLHCPSRSVNGPAFFVSRKTNENIPEGECPDCALVGQRSKLVEVMTCRRCGYLYGALQDLGPRRAQNPVQGIAAHFDSFSTELGWSADSYWSYFSTEPELPYPGRPADPADDDEDDDLIKHPAEVKWCAVCAKKRDDGAGDNCVCDAPQLRVLKLFHRQCKTTGRAADRSNLLSHEKELLNSCPNCAARNSSGIEPLQRFQESDDEMGLAMAIPLAHFQLRPTADTHPPRKLLCFTDHRQRAAAFPSLLEEETFSRDMGRKILKHLRDTAQPIDLITLGEHLADCADANSDDFDSEFFLPVSRFPDEELDARAKRNLWLAEAFAYFGVPDSARESLEDLGLATVEYALSGAEKEAFADALRELVTPAEAHDLLQVLLGFVRQRKAFTLPKGRVHAEDVAFGRVTADISYVETRKGIRNTNGWLPAKGKQNVISDVLTRSLRLEHERAIEVARHIWGFLTQRALLIEKDERWKLNHEKLFVRQASGRFVCNRCGTVTTLSLRACCPRKACPGALLPTSFDSRAESVVAQWIDGSALHRFSTLKSEEHTAQINKELAKRIEDRFRAPTLPGAMRREMTRPEAEYQLEGVNLLSSTTTFEMGINIGDLQKVLLRNAPPSSASYVQRVGRAGRGKDKNSIAVTLCRRTKYDADAWAEPARLMSGLVRAPVVYLRNRVIAQRHFNAVAFAQFLRQKIRDDRVLGDVGQAIRLEAFLPVSARENIPSAWIRIRPVDTHLDFDAWFQEQDEPSLFGSVPSKEIVEAVGGMDRGSGLARKTYKQIIVAVEEELKALMRERQESFLAGGHQGDLDKAIKNLLGSDVISVLARRGFLPRYAFPLDVVTLETGKTRWSRDSEVELNRDRGIAIAEFAPGAQVIAHKKVFTSAGLYIVGEKDQPRREWFSKCPSCEQIRVGVSPESLIGPCNVCKRGIGPSHTQAFVVPAAFSVRADEKSTRFRRSTLIRQRQSLTHFIDHVEPQLFDDRGLFSVAVKDSGSLFRYNMGPANEGFVLCSQCGTSEPMRSYRAGKQHPKLRRFTGSDTCGNPDVWRNVAFGHQFHSYCLIARPKSNLESVESVAFALQRGICKRLDLEASDIGVSWRWVTDGKERTGSEIVLYDQAPGGAGFVAEAAENWASVIAAALEICDTCTCEAACYECLKSYANQAHHDRLDRKAVVRALAKSK
jgi:ATP-dependent helicase YprA (DUF1998 family)